MPNIAEKESCKLIFPAAKGLSSRRNASAAERDVTESFSRPTSGAISNMVCIKAARTADGERPLIITNSQTSAMQRIALRLPFPRIKRRKATRKLTCMPA